MRTNYRFHPITHFQVLTVLDQKDSNQVNRKTKTFYLIQKTK